MFDWSPEQVTVDTAKEEELRKMGAECSVCQQEFVQVNLLPYTLNPEHQKPTLCICVCLYMHIYIYMSMHKYMYINMFTCICMFKYIHTAKEEEMRKMGAECFVCQQEFVQVSVLFASRSV